MHKTFFACCSAAVLTLSLAVACGGSSSGGGNAGSAGTGGSAGSSAGSGGSAGSSAGSGGSAGSSAGSGGSAGSSAGSGGSTGGSSGGSYLDCFDESGKLTNHDLKTCTGDTCTFLVHQTDCCGNTLLIGVESSKLAELQACEAAWAATLPACGCPAGPPEIEKPAGTTVGDPSAAQVLCDNWTMSSGICLTQPK
jgi:hypothetical protein